MKRESIVPWVLGLLLTCGWVGTACDSGGGVSPTGGSGGAAGKGGSGGSASGGSGGSTASKSATATGTGSQTSSTGTGTGSGTASKSATATASETGKTETTSKTDTGSKTASNTGTGSKTDTGGKTASNTGTGSKTDTGSKTASSTVTATSATKTETATASASNTGTTASKTASATSTATVSGTASTGTGTGTGTGSASTGTAVVTGTGIEVSSTCKMPTWPSKPSTTKTISGTLKGSFDGGAGRTFVEGDGNDCTNGAQGSTKAIIEVPDGGSVKHVVFGSKVSDGIHCLGTCTIDDVWFEHICDDAVSALGSGTVTITNSGFKNARDKVIQHNGSGGTVVLDNIYVERAGKLYRSCGVGSGCDGKNRTSKLSNIYAVGVGVIAGVNSARGDKSTLKNICVYRSNTVCQRFTNASTSGSEEKDDSDLPDATACNYSYADTHALIDQVAGSFSTDVFCPQNSVKSGSTATACVSGLDRCLKNCTAGSYGFKQMGCGTSGKYEDSVKCALPKDSTVAGHLAGSNATSASGTGKADEACSSEWAWAMSSTKYCVCVNKAGQYQNADAPAWTTWDCQSQWW